MPAVVRTSFGALSPQMMERLARGGSGVGDVARELIAQAGKAGDAQALSQVMRELEAFERGGDIATVAGAGGGDVAVDYGRRSVASSPLAAVKMSGALTHDTAVDLLRTVFARFPSLQVDLEQGRLVIAAKETAGVGAARAEQLARMFAEDRPAFLKARAVAMETPLPPAQPQKRRAVVSGLSNGGMVAVALLAKSGYHVDAFEKRTAYTRNIQYGGRQALIDQLTCIDPKLCDQFLARIASHAPKGYVHTVDGVREVHDAPKPQPGDPANLPADGDAMFAQSSAVILECKAFEELLFEYVSALPNVTVHRGSSMTLHGPDAAGMYDAVTDEGVPLGTPDLVVVSEGGASATFRALGVKSVATSPADRFIAGVVHEGSGGLMAGHFHDVRRADGSVERVLTSAMGSAKLDKTWVVAGVAGSVEFDPQGVDPKSPAYLAAQRDLIERGFRDGAALVMEKSPEELACVPVTGPVAKTGPTLFTLQQRMSERAVVGANVIGFGDVVGCAHFSVGGGMQIATIAHAQRLKKLVFEIERGADRAEALRDYDAGALEDTIAWGRRGIADFYPYVSWQEADRAYVQAIAEWRKGNVKEPLEALEKLLGRRPHLKPVDATPKKTAAA